MTTTTKDKKPSSASPMRRLSGTGRKLPLPERIAKARFDADTSGQIAEYVLKKYDLTQVELARILRADQSYISRVVRRQRSFTFGHLDAIGEALGVPMAVLIWRALPPPPPASGGARKLDAIDEMMMEVFPEFAKEK